MYTLNFAYTTGEILDSRITNGKKVRFGVAIVAEFVCSADIVTRMGVDYLQGYARPLPTDSPRSFVNKERIAVFIDAENVAGWIKRGGVEALLEELSSIGPTIVRRAYGVWTRGELAAWQSELNRLGFELVHCYHPVSGKNASDIQMVVDVMEYVGRIEEIGWYALATGDSDFSPLFRRLRELGKEVVGIGPRSPLSESVKSSCTRYIYTDFAKEEAKTLRRSEYDSALDSLENILEAIEEPIHVSQLKQRLMTIDSAFSEKRLGFKSFHDFLEATGLVRLTREGDHTWLAAPLREENDHAAAMPSPAHLGSEGAAEQYQALLRRQGWRIVPRAVLLQTWRLLRTVTAHSKEGLILRILDSGDESVSAQEARKSVMLLSKARAFVVKNDRDGGTWEIDRSLKEEELLRMLDTQIAAHILHAGKLTPDKIDRDAIVGLLLGEYDADGLEELLLCAAHSETR